MGSTMRWREVEATLGINKTTAGRYVRFLGVPRDRDTWPVPLVAGLSVLNALTPNRADHRPPYARRLAVTAITAWADAERVGREPPRWVAAAAEEPAGPVALAATADEAWLTLAPQVGADRIVRIIPILGG